MEQGGRLFTIIMNIPVLAYGKKRPYGIVTRNTNLAHFSYDVDEWEIYMTVKKIPNGNEQCI